MKLTDLLDPDTNWRSLSTILHYLSGLGLMLVFWPLLGLPWLQAFGWTFWTAVIYEAGQTDSAYNIKDAGGKRWAGRPGFGFGLMDIGACQLGAITATLAVLLVRVVL